MTNVTNVSGWKKSSSGVGGRHEVKVPSGNIALCRRPGMDTFLKLGMLPNSLMSIVQKNIQKAQKGAKDEDIQKNVADAMDKLLEDPQKIGEVFEMADRVVCFIVIQPEVHLVPDDPAERDPELLYVDEVLLDDKMFLFNWAVGGAEDLASFFREQGEVLEPASDSQDVELPSQPVAGY